MSVSLSSCLLLFLSLASGLSVAQTTLTAAAAADLSSLEPDLASSFGKNNPAIQVRFVSQSSASLAQGIENGAPYDLFLSANAGFVDRLSSFGKLQPASVRPYAVGRLGLMWRDGKTHPFSDLAGAAVRFCALPNPKLAPYGVAAQQALEHEHLWIAVQPKVVYGENVRQALQLLDSGNADAVITADSLLVGRSAQVLPAEWHHPILQKAGIVSTTKHPEAARRFLEFLVSPAGQVVFARYGFSPPPSR
jgi:molybdate transport system substrate-binding protein